MTDAVLSSGFLSGIRVLQIGDDVTGSAAAALLTSLGADVTRTAPTANCRAGPLITTANGTAAAVDLVLDRGKNVLADGIDADPADYDIVITDGATSAVAPRDGVVLVTVSPFGATGPLSHRPGGEITMQASGGLLATIEDADGVPVPAPGYVASKAAGAVTALAALHGLDRRNRDGGAVVVDVSAQEAVIFTAALPECAHVLYRCPGRAGSGRYLAPSGVFPCRDGLVRITAVENHQWKGLRAALGEPEWAAGLDERPARIENADTINARVTEWTSTRHKADCADLLQAHGVPSTPVNHPSELLASPQFAYRGSLQSVRLAGTDTVVPGPPWSISRGGPTARARRQGLTGLRIAELTHVLAGPIVGALLGAMGATVVRIEDPERLDIYRRSGPFADGVAGPERGAYYAVANHSKHSVLLDPAHACEDVAAILADSDVLIENVGSSRLQRLAVDPGELAESGRLTLRVSGFGSDGPLAGYRVYANNVQSYGGLAGLTTTTDGTPARLGTVLADPLSSVVGAVVIAAWAIGPCRTSGAVVDLSMAEVVTSTVSEFVAAATEHPPTGGAVARGVHRATDDRWVAVELSGEQCDTERAEFVAMLIATNRAEDAAFKLQGAGVEAAVIRRAGELINDPHLTSRGFFPEIAHPDPDLGTGQLVGLPWQFVGEGPVPLAPPPALGSSTADYTRTSHADITTT